MTATVEKMNSLKAMAHYFRPDDADVAINSLNTAWTRAKLKGDLQLGEFSRGRTDLTAYEHDFAKSWFDNDKVLPSVQTAIAPQIGNEMRDEIKRLKVEKTDLIAQHQTALTAQAEKALNDFEQQGKSLRSRIGQLEKQLTDKDAVTESRLDDKERLLNNQIADLKKELTRVNDKLDRAQTDERTRAEAVKVAHEKALRLAALTLEDATAEYQRMVALNAVEWQVKLDNKDREIVKMLAAHEAELAPHLVSLAERKAKVTILEVINYFEILGAIVGAGIMFHAVGVVLGIPAALFYYDSMNTVKKASSWESSKFAIFVCTVLSVAFAFIHYNSALTYNTSDAYPKSIVATVAAVISSGVSVAALYQNYLKKNENV